MEYCQQCCATYSDIASLRYHEQSIHGAIGNDWTPTADNVNALPGPLRRYVHDLETRCDPAGERRELVLLRDENAMLRGAIAVQRSP